MGRLLPLVGAATLLLLHHCHMAFTLNQEGLYLLQVKRVLDDPDNALADWNPRDTAPCNWTGVYCSISGDVTAVDLTNFNLTGPFPSTLCRLPKLSFLSLSSNYINSSLPSSSLLPCTSLTHLDLSQNNLVGPLPSLVPSLPLLRHLDLAANNFSGPIPPSFAFFPSLEVLSLTYNLLNGTISSFLGNLTSLRQLNLSYNPFAGPIPLSLSNLTNLNTLWLASCSLTGEIPPALGGLSKLTNLDLSTNFLTGGIPETVSSLSSVVQIELYNNRLTGRLPSGLSNLTALRRIDASVNNLSGPIPADIFSVPNLESLHLFQNQITGSVPSNAAKARNLFDLRLFVNQLSGTLPEDLGSNSPLMYLDLSNNQLSGMIPRGICHGGVLLQLLLINNNFSGNLPTSLGQCPSLYRVRLSYNHFSGDLPASMWGLPHLWILELRNNSLTGKITRDIARAANLSKLLIDMNQFSGEIPAEIGSLNKLFEFSASDNRLTGPLPESLERLTELGQLDLHNNLLTGELLTGILSLKKLTLINLANNNLTGTIPQDLGSLPVLNYLDLSGNNLTGEIPLQLQNLKLNQFNLSNNQLSGPIPYIFDNEAYKTSFLGNPGLCWDLAGLCPSSTNSRRSRINVLWLLRAIFIFAAVVLISGIAWFYSKYRMAKKAKKAQKSKWTLTSFHKLGFNEYEILESLDKDNVIGSGASGKVYKVVLVNGEVVAVKQLWRTSKMSYGNHDQAGDDAFDAEVETLGKIRHKNIVKLLCCCAHKDCKLLVYEFMQNGSLGDLLHSCKASVLEWPTRYKIALNAAEGLCYLHHDCVPPIVHRDIKSNNILLDAEFGAKVADFGVAKIVGEVEMEQRSMSFIAGSCGYIAPEYAYTLRVNEKSDIYSFGVVILELVTGKRPVDPEFGEKDLVKWVCSTIQHKGEEHVIDSKLDLCHKEEITKVLHIGLFCTSTLPINRPTMRKVVKMLLDARKPESCSKDDKLSTYCYGNY